MIEKHRFLDSICIRVVCVMVLSLIFLCDILVHRVYADSMSLEAGSGLLGMQTADTYKMAQYSVGMFGFAGRREYFLQRGTSKYVTTEETVGMFAVPVTVGITRRLELNAGIYGYHAARPFENTGNIYQYYASPKTGLGSVRLGMKYLLTQNPSRFAASFKMSVVGGTSSDEFDGLNYRWARADMDAELSMLERVSLRPGIAMHFEQGIVLTNSSLYDHQLVFGTGIEYTPHRIVTLGMVLNNRTFMGVSPQSLIQSVYDPFGYWNDTERIGDANYLVDNDVDFLQDYFVVVPSITVTPHDRISVQAGAVINITDRDGPVEDFQGIIGVTFRGSMYYADTDDDGVQDRADREPETPEGYPVDKWGVSLDSDSDGVPDGRDRQVMTPKGAIIDSQGVGVDTDRDGVLDGIDQEPNSPPGCLVDAYGVSVDHDHDGVPDCLDADPETPPGCPVDEYGVALDTDGDGVPDCLDREKNTPAGSPVDDKGISLERRNRNVR